MENSMASTDYARLRVPAHACFPEEALRLGGKWRCLFLKAAQSLPQDYWEPDFPDKKWSRVQLPGLLEPQEKNRNGRYSCILRRSFRLPEEWRGRKVQLRLPGFSAPAQLWVNGKALGKLSHIPTEFDITQLLIPGEKICVCLLLETIPGKLEWARCPEVYSLAKRYIRDLSAHAQVECEPNRAVLTVRLAVENADGLTARVAVMDGDRVCFYGEGIIQDGLAQVQILCHDLRLWTAETPSLYKIAVILWDGIGICHTRQILFGFRSITIEDSRLRINDRPLRMQGVNLLTDEIDNKDLAAMKAHHINALRLHNPMDEAFYQQCDRHGLYVIADHGGTEDLVAMYRSHPSIVLWRSACDDHRFSEENLFCLDVPGDDIMERINSGQEILIKSAARQKNHPAGEGYQKLPWLIRSFGEFRGNGSTHIEKLAEQMEQNSQWCGAFLWNYKESANLSGLVTRDGIPHHSLSQVQKVWQPIHCTLLEDGSIRVENRYCFLSSKGFRCQYRLNRDGETVESGSLTVDVPPMGVSIVQPCLRDDMFRPGRYHLTITFRNRQDALISYDCWEVMRNRHVYDLNPGGTIRDDGSKITLRAEGIVYTINRTTGNLDQIYDGKAELLTMPLCPVFHRAMTDAQRGDAKLRNQWSKMTWQASLPRPSIVEVDHMAHRVTVSQNVASGLMRTYHLHADGSLTVEMRLRTGKTIPDRVGMHCAVGPAFGCFEWFGLGPWDTYPDRMDYGWYGIHRQSVKEQDLYPRPQELGNKERVYRLKLTDDHGRGLHIQPEESLSASCWPWSLSDLSSAQTQEALPAHTATTLNLTCCQNGLMDQRLKPHTTYIMTFTIKPIG